MVLFDFAARHYSDEETQSLLFHGDCGIYQHQWERAESR